MELLGRAVKESRKEQQLTQEALSNLAGVPKAQINKIENNTNSASIETIYKVFRALKKNLEFSITLDNQQIQLV